MYVQEKLDINYSYLLEQFHIFQNFSSTVCLLPRAEQFNSGVRFWLTTWPVGDVKRKFLSLFQIKNKMTPQIL